MGKMLFLLFIQLLISQLSFSQKWERLNLADQIAEDQKLVEDINSLINIEKNQHRFIWRTGEDSTVFSNFSLKVEQEKSLYSKIVYFNKLKRRQQKKIRDEIKRTLTVYTTLLIDLKKIRQQVSMTYLDYANFYSHY